MSRGLPWDDIGIPADGYIVRVVVGCGSVPARWGKDTDGNLLFLLKLAGNHREQFGKDRISVHGIDIDLRQSETAGEQLFVLTLERDADADLFFALCEAMVSTLSDVESPSAALALALTHVRRWKAFLAGRGDRLLRPEEVRGLFAELTFLRGLYQGVLSSPNAVAAWTGADRVHQDFIFGGRAVEVKSLFGSDRSTVRISSEDQLETIEDNLFLVTYRLSDLAGASNSLSLNRMVQLIEGELQDAAAIEEFNRKLVAYGYVPREQYDMPEFGVSGVQSYRVGPEFPRLIRSELPAGVTKVLYQIELEAIDPFRCEFEDVLGKP